MKRIIGCILIIFTSIIFAIEASPEALALFDAKLYVNAHEDTLLYRMLSPQTIKANKKYPLVLFLHGVGERGNDNERQLIWGAGAFITEKNLKKYPCYVIAPQCPEDKRWLEKKWDVPHHEMPENPSETMALTMELLDEMQKIYPIDGKRIYVTGLSMGGFGTWDIISRMPKTFAAAALVCGGGDEHQAGKLAHMPIWVFHGEDDTVVPVERSQNMVNAIREAGSKKIKYTEYEEIGHGSWKPAYADPKLLRWMFRQRRR